MKLIINKEIKNCPFCGSEACLEEELYHHYSSSYTTFVVSCLDCKARTKDIFKTSMIDFTKHSVDDFRKNPSLRAKEDDRLDLVNEEKKLIAVEMWNKRTL